MKRLSLEDPVSKWIPEFAKVELTKRDTAPLRIRQILSHSAGFPEDNPAACETRTAPFSRPFADAHTHLQSLEVMDDAEAKQIAAMNLFSTRRQLGGSRRFES
jgi:CubicO group peptidase (beta-lactamase class C family)